MPEGRLPGLGIPPLRCRICWNICMRRMASARCWADEDCEPFDFEGVRLPDWLPVFVPVRLGVLVRTDWPTSD